MKHVPNWYSKIGAAVEEGLGQPGITIAQARLLDDISILMEDYELLVLAEEARRMN